MRIFMIRHGATDWTEGGRLQGWSDQPLNAAGIRQARSAARLFAARLDQHRLAAIYTSDLLRARQTAIELVDELQLAGRVIPPAIHAAELREIHFGEWEGLTYAEIAERDPQALANWEADWKAFYPPGGESLRKFGQRVSGFLANLKNQHNDPVSGASANPDEGAILLIAHGGTLGALTCAALDLPPARYWQFHLDPGGLAEISLYPAGAMINLWNLIG